MAFYQQSTYSHRLHQTSSNHFKPTFYSYPFEFDRIIRRYRNLLAMPFSFYTQSREIKPDVPICYDKSYFVKLDITGYSPKSIKTEVKDGKLHVIGSEELKNDNGDYARKSFHKSYDLPSDIDPGVSLTSYCNNGQLQIEIPLRAVKMTKADDLFPNIEDNGKRVTMKCKIPLNTIDPSKISVICKNDEVSIYGEEIEEIPGKTTKKTYQKRFNMPSNTDFNSLVSFFDKNSVIIEAKLL
jgi:HSP20 family molecular chaperone IbpA